ncbi:MAG: ATP-binding protein [Syntrophothermus sp.]
MKRDTKSRLRKIAENQLNPIVPENYQNFSEADIIKLIHELQIHQIELELQNEELNESLAKQEELSSRYQHLYRFAPVGYFSLDDAGNIKEVNLMGTQMLGFPKKHLVGRSFFTFLPNDQVEWFSKFLSEIYLSKATQQCEIRINTDDHPEKIVYMEGSNDGASGGCLISMTDITEIRNTELNLQNANKKLKEIISLKEKLLSVIGHDLKGPLTNILVFFNMFQNEILDNKDQKFQGYIHEIIFDAEQALIFLENLMDWSRLRSDLFRYQPEMISPGSIVNRIFNLFASAAVRKNIKLINPIPLDFYCKTDEFLVTTILRNTITNGIKFSNSGGEVKVSVKNNPKTTEFITSDEGTGINSETINKIVSGSRVEPAFGTAMEPGSGFGLFLCRELVNLFGGELWIISRVNEGTSIHFTLPTE